MLSNDVLTKIRAIEIHTRRLLSSSLVGDNRSAIKGTGFEFDQIRDYQLGDDIRCVDWKSSARAQKLLVKQYTEERSRSIIVAADVSSSGMYSSSAQMRHEIIAQMVGVLCMVAAYGNDRVGLLLFSDEVELFVPLHKGFQHARMIMEKIFTFHAKRSTTKLNAGFSHLVALPERDAVVFFISDFIDEGFENTMRVVAHKHDLIAVRCLDTYETALPACGFIEVEDSESGEWCTLDVRGNDTVVASYLTDRLVAQNALFKKYGIERLDIALDKPFINDLIRFFRRRMMY